MAAYNLGANKNQGRVLLDFILRDGKGEKAIAERNIYRCRVYNGALGRKGVLLRGWSWRVYGADLEYFGHDIQTNRKPCDLPLMNLPYPEVKLD